jgi:ABC-type transporter MlaC component
MQVQVCGKGYARCWLLLCSLLLLPLPATAFINDPGSVPLRRSLPNGLDLLESGLYWLQDMSGVDNPRDPASIIALMEDQAARFFDFAYMSYLVAGPHYTQLNALQRSHFQNRVRDQLFTALARRMGMFNVRMPGFRPLRPWRTGPYSWSAGADIHHPGGPSVRLVFHFYLSSRGWRIYDVTSNGVSAIATLRQRHFDNRF